MFKLIKIAENKADYAHLDFWSGQNCDIWDPESKYYEKLDKLRKMQENLMTLTLSKDHIDGKHYFGNKHCQLCSETILRLINGNFN